MGRIKHYLIVLTLRQNGIILMDTNSLVFFSVIFRFMLSAKSFEEGTHTLGSIFIFSFDEGFIIESMRTIHWE